MRTIDPGHEYVLDTLDGSIEQRLIFVKREGEKYPGNVGSHAGTTTQEVLRAVGNRLRYVNQQMPCAETQTAEGLIETAILLLELRAARLHGRNLDLPLYAIVDGSVKCKECGHVGCPGSHDKGK